MKFGAVGDGQVFGTEVKVSLRMPTVRIRVPASRPRSAAVQLPAYTRSGRQQMIAQVLESLLSCGRP